MDVLLKTMRGVVDCHTLVSPLPSPVNNSNLEQNIQQLGEGDVDSRDGALQILLLLGYIFDWASDLFLLGIQRQLMALSKHSEELKICRRQNLSSEESDSDSGGIG